MEIVADENISLLIIARLRADGHSVWAITESQPGISDVAVLQEATRQQKLLLSGDKDFGDLLFRDHHSAPHGVVLHRLPESLRNSVKADIIGRAFEVYGSQFTGMFSVIDEHNVRIRPLP